MSTDADPIESQEGQLNTLLRLLEEQIEMIKKSDFRDMEALSDLSGTLLTKIIKNQAPEPMVPKDDYERLVELYRKLELMIAAEKESARRQLQKVGNWKKTIQAYHSKR